jgi:hypothetical protein
LKQPVVNKKKSVVKSYKVGKIEEVYAEYGIIPNLNDENGDPAATIRSREIRRRKIKNKRHRVQQLQRESFQYPNSEETFPILKKPTASSMNELSDAELVKQKSILS